MQKKKFLFLLNFYDNFNLDQKKKNQINSDHNSWEQIFSSLTFNNANPKIFYLNFLKKKIYKKRSIC